MSTGSSSLREHLDTLDEAGLLQRITAPVDPEHEIGAIAARCIDRGGPALVFENVVGHPGATLVTNLLSSPRHLGVAFRTDPDERQIYTKIVEGMQERIPSTVVATGPCKEEIDHGDEVDLYKFPTPIWHELDGGAYIATTAGVITRNPDTGVLNMGSYRCMIRDRNTLTMSGGVRGRIAGSDANGGGDHALANEKHGRPTPVAIALGMDPYLSLATGTSVITDELGMAEFEAAGAWRGRPTELVRCETSDLLVPAEAEIVLEGEFVPNERAVEGPHGEATGFYGQTLEAWVIKIHCITQRKNPISYGLICRLLEDYPRSLLRSGSTHAALTSKTGMRNIRETYFPEVGQGGMLIVAADIEDADEPRRIMDAVWDLSNWRWVVVVDGDCDVHNWREVTWRMVSLADPKTDIYPGQERARQWSQTDEDFEPPSTGLGIDATMRFKTGRRFPPVNTVSHELNARVAARWQELDLERW